MKSITNQRRLRFLYENANDITPAFRYAVFLSAVTTSSFSAVIFLFPFWHTSHLAWPKFSILDDTLDGAFLSSSPSLPLFGTDAHLLESCFWNQKGEPDLE